MTLQLFDVLLSAPLYSVVYDLVLVHWPDSSERPCLMTPTKEISTERHQLEESIKDYLSLVPEELTSCKHIAGDLGLEQYLIDAHHQVSSLSESTEMQNPRRIGICIGSEDNALLAAANLSASLQAPWAREVPFFFQKAEYRSDKSRVCDLSLGYGNETTVLFFLIFFQETVTLSRKMVRKVLKSAICTLWSYAVQLQPFQNIR